jgi:tetratricopeptide (TPR) repeat protein
METDPLVGLPDLERLSRYDDRQRQEPADRPAVEGAAAIAAARLDTAQESGNPEAVLSLLGYPGNARRLLGRTDEAAALLERAVDTARELGNVRALVANLIRLGEALRYGGQLEAAERHYRAALELVRAEPAALAGYEDFALQHLGKCRLEQGDAARAIACFEQALALRHAKGAPDLIASTEAALKLARNHPAESPPEP